MNPRPSTEQETGNRPVTARLEGSALVDHLTEPRSIAIVGASSKPGSYAHRAMTYLRDLGYDGSLYLVNPNRAEIDGIACHSSIEDLPAGGVDLAYVAVSADKVAQTVEQLAVRGVPVSITIANGVSTADKVWIAEVARREGVRVIGPNCIGVVSTRRHAYASFSAVVGQQRPRRGRIALVTQSGAMGNALLLSVTRRGAGISHWFTTGDEAEVGTFELVAGLLAQEDVDAVGVFLEGIGDSPWLEHVRTAIEATGKRVYLVKGAQTAAGRDAAAGHTGRVVGSGEASVRVLQEAGINVLPTMAQLADALVMTDLIGHLPGSRTAVVSVSGGCGVLAADAIVRSSTLEMADISGDAALRSKLDGRVHEVSNPLDVGGTPTAGFSDWVTSVASSPSSDVVIAIQANIMHDESVLVETINRGSDGTPVVVTPFSEEDSLSPAAILALAAKGVAVMPSADRAIAALATLPQTRTPAPVVSPSEHSDAGVTGLEDAVARLGADLPWAPWEIAGTADEAIEFGRRHGFPLVMKAAGRTLQHRSEAGAVAVGVDLSNVATKFEHIDAIVRPLHDAVLVQKQTTFEWEIMVSAMVDPELGPLVLVRPGGVLTELLDGSTVLWGGWSPAMRRASLEKSLVGTLLSGYRGGKPVHFAPLLDLVERLLAAVGEGKADFIELNPVMVDTAAVHLVDALIR